jgi:hypothetical protein
LALGIALLHCSGSEHRNGSWCIRGALTPSILW